MGGSLLVASDWRWKVRASLAIAGACLIVCSGCAAAPDASDEIVVGANHRHSPDILRVTVLGLVPEIGKKIGVTAKFSESEDRLDGLSIQYAEGGTVMVPRKYFENVLLPRENSLSLAYILAGDSKTVGGIWVFLDFGELRLRKDLKCETDTGDPVFKSFTLLYDTHLRTFTSSYEDYCGEPIPD